MQDEELSTRLAAVDEVKLKITRQEIAQHEERTRLVVKERIEQLEQERSKRFKDHSEQYGKDHEKLKDLRTRFSNIAEEEEIRMKLLKDHQK